MNVIGYNAALGACANAAAYEAAMDLLQQMESDNSVRPDPISISLSIHGKILSFLLLDPPFIPFFYVLLDFVCVNFQYCY